MSVHCAHMRVLGLHPSQRNIFPSSSCRADLKGSCSGEGFGVNLAERLCS